MNKTLHSLGQYQPGDAFLHRLDPRMKIVGCALLVILAFASQGWLQSGVVVGAAGLLGRSGGPAFGRALRNVWMFRWLLLFTLLMHLFFSPGHTLFGLAWLSKDGLLLGLQVCLQVVVAVVSASLLAATTPTEEIVRALGWFLTPLGLLSCRTAEWQRSLFLVFRFVPLVQQEVVRAGEAGTKGEAVSGQGRLDLWGRRLRSILFRLVDRADAMAHAHLRGEDSLDLPGVIRPLWPITAADRIFLVAGGLLVLLYTLANG